MKRTRLILPLTAFALLVSFGITACGGAQGENSQQQSGEGQQEKIAITAAEGKTKLIKGESVQLTPSVEGVTWESDHPEIASVSEAGLVQGLAAGSAKITAKKNGYQDGTISIKVELEKITITASATSVEMGGTVTLTPSKDGVTWSSSNPEVATVANGVVTAVYAGQATIKAEKEGFAAGTVTITVTRPAATAELHFEKADHFAADGWWGSDETGFKPDYARDSGNASDSMCIAHFGNGDKETLTFTSNAAVQAELVMTVAASNAISDMSAVMDVKFNNAAVDISGKGITGGSSSTFEEFSLGNLNLLADNNVLEITFKEASSYPYLDNLNVYAKSAAVVAQVDAPAKPSIEVQSLELTVNRGETAQINITTPADKTGIAYASDNAEMASVNASGLVTGESLGTAHIIVSKEGMISARITVTITDTPLPGEIRVEAEDQADGFDWESLGFHMYPDGSYIRFGHSGGAYITGYDVSDEISLTYTFTSDKDQAMTFVISGAPHYQMSEDYIFGTDCTIKLNDNEVTCSDTAKIEKPATSGTMGAKTQNVIIGDVNVKNGSNTLVLEFHKKAPALDCYKFLPKA